ncbi:glucose-methanol-choline oxidoreductase, partial [Dissophora ornata]
PLIDPHYLSESFDVRVFVEAARFLRMVRCKLNEDPEIGGWEVHPGEKAAANGDYEAPQRHAGVNVETYYHPVSTCKMDPSSDSMSVVEARLNVYGIERLRVIDASFIPKVPAAHACAPMVMIADK